MDDNTKNPITDSNGGENTFPAEPLPDNANDNPTLTPGDNEGETIALEGETDLPLGETAIPDGETGETESVSEFHQFIAGIESKEESAPVEVQNDAIEYTLGGEASNAKKKGGKKGALVAIILILLLLTGALVTFIVYRSSSASAIDFDKTAVTVSDVECSVGEYIYWYATVDAYYYSYYSYYYSSITEEEKKDSTLNQLTYINGLYAAAVKAGLELDEDDKANIDETIANTESSAEAQSMTVDEYLANSFGKGYSVDILKVCLEKQALAQKYYDSQLDELSKDYVGDALIEKVNAEYAANKTQYDISDVSYWYFDSTDESAAANAKAVADAVAAGSSFDSAIQSVTGQTTDIARTLNGYSLSTLSSQFSEKAAQWIFETDSTGAYVNGAGAVTTIEENGAIYVFYVNNPPARDEAVPVTAQYIKVAVSDNTAVKSEEELRLEAKNKANDIFTQLSGTDITETAFSAAVQKYDNGDDELISGDVFDNAKPDGSNDAAIEAWLFSSERKAGDCEIIEAADGFYIIFFSSVAENPVWYTTISETVISSAQQQWSEDFSASYADSIVTVDEVIAEAVAYMASLQTATA